MLQLEREVAGVERDQSIEREQGNEMDDKASVSDTLTVTGKLQTMELEEKVDTDNDDIEEIKSSETKNEISSLPAIDVSTPKGMDDMFEFSFLAGLRVLKESKLPMRCELFYTNCLLPQRPSNVQLDLKKSTLKKQQTIFALFEKKKLSTTKTIHKLENIVSVDREHALYKKHCAAMGALDAQGSGVATEDTEGDGMGSDAASATSTGKTSSTEKQNSAKIAVSLVYRASTMYRSIFGDRAVGNKDRLYSEEKCAEALVEYCGVNKLFVDGDGQGDIITLDILLGKELFGKKEVEGPWTEMPVRLVLPRLLKKLQVHTKVDVERAGVSPQSVILKRKLRHIKINVERRGGRKHITSISGLEDFCIDPETFSQERKKKFSASTSTQKLPGNTETVVEIGIQGKVLRDLVLMLRNDWGIPQKYVELDDKSK